MAGDVFDLVSSSVHLEDGPAATPFSTGERGSNRGPSDGRVVGLARARQPADLHPDMWERHPEGDELLVLISGALDLVLETASGERIVELRPGSAYVVPQGDWHRFVQREPSDLLYVVRGKGTELRPR